MIDPQRLVCPSGEEIIIVCNTLLTTTWYKDGLLLTDSNKMIMNIIKINHATELDTGIYLCNGTLLNGRRFAGTSEVFVGSKRFNTSYICNKKLKANLMVVECQIWL